MSDKHTVGNKFPSRQVSILAQRKKRINHNESIQKFKSKNIRRALHKKKIGFHKPEYFITKCLLEERDNNRLTRRILNKGLSVEIPEDKKILVILRHRTKKVASPAVQKALDTLGVSFLHKASIVRVNTEVKALLGICEPYITYGYPTITTIRQLLFKHGFMLIDGKRVPISSNAQIEEHLGQHGIICVEDIIHEIVTIGDHFDIVIKHLGSFSLKNPQDGYFDGKRGVSFNKGGQYGNRGDRINEIIEKCM